MAHLLTSTVDRPLVGRTGSTVGDGGGAASTAAAPPPAEFDGYRLLEEIGRGAMGTVYKGWDTVLDRPVAVKFIEALADSAAARERFRLEARAVARLQHPNVVAIYRVGETTGRPYLITEFVRGKSLESLPLPLAPAEALRLGTQLARGLDAAHRHGVMHRDIKPANAILSDAGELKLVDFGLAKLLDDSGDERLPLPKGGGPSGLDGFLGTPAYMAPEIWRGEPSTFRSDIYSAGALLYHLCAGRPPHVASTLPDLGVAVLSGAPSRLDAGSGVDPALAAVIARCLEADPRSRFGHGGELREALELLAPDRRARAVPDGNPYRGLQSFQPEHRSVFFGRDAEVRAVLDRLRTEPFVLVAGTSGVGKSSLCRAGVLPRVQDGALEDGIRWTVVTLTPGRHPVLALAAALSPLLDEDEDTLAKQLQEQWPEVARALRRKHRQGEGLVVFFDQLEELITLSEPSEARAIAEIIEGLSQLTPGLRLLATVRGDFIARLASLPAMAEAVARSLYLLRPLGDDGLREAIVGPAHATGLAFEGEAMVSVLVEASRAEGALPLLQFTLAELWDRRDVERRRIPIAALEALGGVEGALARHADGVIGRMTAGQRVAARRMLLRLVTLENTRARRAEAELSGLHPDAKEALAGLVRGRIVIASEAPDGWAYEVAHEALIGSWPALLRWLEEAAESRAVRERLCGSAGEWDRKGRRRDELWTARQLREVELLDETELLPLERAFVAAARRTALWSRRLRWASGLGLVLLALGGYATMRARAELAVAARVAALVGEAGTTLSGARTALAQVERLRHRALESFDLGHKEEAEGLWAEAIEGAGEGELSLAHAAQKLEAALSLSPDEPGARALLADTLFERALSADRDRRVTQRDEQLARLALYDDGGARLARWNQPARLTIETRPAGAEVELAVYQRAKDGARALGPFRRLGHAPLAELELEPGSYLLRLRLDGHAELNVPVLLTRGARPTLTISMPRTDEVPAGFVFVPEGAFLFGSTAEDQVRRDFFFAAPVHEVRTEAFLIARHETTFREWLAFLDALPEPERARRTPSVGGGLTGALSLRRASGQWNLRFQPAGVLLEAKAGERLRLAGRDGPIDWLNLPVIGINLDDAEAYLAWLDSTGKVPGARLCTEVEWERAARGADDREYPHGDRLRPGDANYDETYGKRPDSIAPDEVGTHPASRSPFGVDDLVGNVWEWTRATLGHDPVARGGSYRYGTTSARSTNREVVEPSLRDASVGLRVCATPPSPR